MGGALPAWEQAEERLARLALIFSGTQDANAANVIRYIFGSIEASSVRLNVLTVLVRLYFRHYWKWTKVRDPFKELIEGFRLAAYRRNEIAHGKVLNLSVVNPSEAGQSVQTHLGVFLIAPEYIVSRNRDMHEKWDSSDPLSFIRSNYRYNADDISTFWAKFEALNMLIMKYIVKCATNEHRIRRSVFELLKDRELIRNPLT